MNKYDEKINTKEINRLRDIVSGLEHELDTLQDVEEKLFLVVRERIFNMIHVIANIEVNMQKQLQDMIEGYFENLYAEISAIEDTLKILNKREMRNVLEKEERF